MSELRKVDQKLHHLRRVEASYRAEIRRLHEAFKDEKANPGKAEAKYKRVKAKYDRKIDKLQPKIKRLTVLRAELKENRTAKG